MQHQLAGGDVASLQRLYKGCSLPLCVPNVCIIDSSIVKQLQAVQQEW